MNGDLLAQLCDRIDSYHRADFTIRLVADLPGNSTKRPPIKEFDLDNLNFFLNNTREQYRYAVLITIFYRWDVVSITVGNYVNTLVNFVERESIIDHVTQGLAEGKLYYESAFDYAVSKITIVWDRNWNFEGEKEIDRTKQLKFLTNNN